jgi:hypothetical protein
MGTNPKGYFLGGMKGRSLVLSEGRKEGGIFFILQDIILLVVWDGVFGESKCVLFIIIISFVIW